MNLLLITVTFLVCLPTLAQQRLFILGGSNPKGLEVEADLKGPVVRLKNALEPLGWQCDVYFGNGQLLNGHAMSKENLRKMEADLANVSSGKVLIWVEAHGANRKTSAIRKDVTGNSIDAPEVSHSIVIEGGLEYSLDNLIEPIRKLTAKGVQVTLMDMSCFSGNSQALAVPGACVVTSSLKNYFAFGEIVDTWDLFEHSFLWAAANDPNLSIEEMFLRARFYDSRDFPQISSLATPNASFYEYFIKGTDASSGFRSARITRPSGACLQCAKADYVPIFERKMEELNDIPEVAQHALSGDLKFIRAEEMKSIGDFMVTFKEISKVELQLNPIPGLPPDEIPKTGYESFTRAELIAKHKQLEDTLYEKSLPIKKWESVFYQQYQTGERSYRKGQQVQHRKQNDCANFKLQ